MCLGMRIAINFVFTVGFLCDIVQHNKTCHVSCFLQETVSCVTQSMTFQDTVCHCIHVDRAGRFHQGLASPAGVGMILVVGSRAGSGALHLSLVQHWTF
jgi:hypothetical protein